MISDKKDKKEGKKSKKQEKKSFDFDRLKELTKSEKMKIDYDFWTDDIKKINELEG